MKERLQRVLEIPWVAHLVRSAQRFGQRLGSQFAAAITYFSVLSVIPVLMVAFAALGLTLTVFMPDALGVVGDSIRSAVAGQARLGDQLVTVVNQTLGSWQSVGAIGLLGAAWSGAAWVNNIRQAVHAQMRPEFDMAVKPTNIVVQTLTNLAILLGLFVLVSVMMGLSAVATGARDAVAGLLNLVGTPWEALLAWAPVAAMLVAGYLLFCFIIWVFSESKVAPKLLAKGALLGAVGMTALLWAAGLVVGVFSRNAAAAAFGSVIIVMLYFNLFATLILFVAAWIATDTTQLETSDNRSAEHAPVQPSDYASKQVVAILQAREERERLATVPRSTAVTAARVSGGAGAVIGAAITGIIATIAAIVSGLLARRR